MEALAAAKHSIPGLFKALTDDTRRLVRQELQLLKTEVSEKSSRLARHLAEVALGGCTVYAGLLLFLFGLGWLLAWAFAQAGLQPMLAGFLGFVAIGLGVMIIGSVLLLKAVKALSAASLAPERTFHTLEELAAGSVPRSKPQTKAAEKTSSAELQRRVETTEHRMKENLDDLKNRLSAGRLKAQVSQIRAQASQISTRVKRSVHAHPYQAGLAAMAAGLVSGLVLRWKFRHAA